MPRKPRNGNDSAGKSSQGQWGDGAPPSSALGYLLGKLEENPDIDLCRVYRVGGDKGRRGGWVLDVPVEDLARIEPIIASHPELGPGTYDIGLSSPQQAQPVGWGRIHVGGDMRPPGLRGTPAPWGGGYGGYQGWGAPPQQGLSREDLRSILAEQRQGDMMSTIIGPLLVSLVQGQGTRADVEMERSLKMLSKGMDLGRTAAEVDQEEGSWKKELVGAAREIGVEFLKRKSLSEEERGRVASRLRKQLKDKPPETPDKTLQRMGDLLAASMLGEWDPEETLGMMTTVFGPERCVEWMRDLGTTVQLAADHSVHFREAVQADDQRHQRWVSTWLAYAKQLAEEEAAWAQTQKALEPAVENPEGGS